MIKPFKVGDLVYIPASALNCGEPLVTVIVGIDEQTVNLYDTGWIAVDFFYYHKIKYATQSQITLYASKKALDISKLLGYIG